jgi:hypothetical protein
VPFTRRDLAIALSLANLCYLRLWMEIFAVSSPGAYYLHTSNADVVALVLNVVLLAAVFLGLTAFARRFGERGRIAIITGFVLVLFAQFNHFGPELAPGLLSVVDRWKNGAHLEALAPLIVIGGIGIAAWRWPTRALKIATGFVYFFAPFVLLTFGRATWIVLKTDPSTSLAPIAPAIGSPVTDSAGPRVVVMVMDAMSRYHSIDARPADLALPEFDRLRAQSLDATNAAQISPRTLISVPTMLSGLAITRSAESSKDELTITVDSAERGWSAAPSVLRDAKDAGGVAIVAGWYHPYCRLFPYLDGCSTYPTRTIGSRARATGFLRALLDQQLSLIPYLSLRLRQVDIFKAQREDLLVAAASGDRGLVFLHLVIPHTPWIWDRTRNDFTLTRFHPDGYYDNLALMDRTLGEIRASMERAGKWDSTAVLLLSDHIMRYRPRYLNEPADVLVPFVLKLPGQTDGVVYERAFNALVTHDLVSALLRGEIKTAEDAARWLDVRSEP